MKKILLILISLSVALTIFAACDTHLTTSNVQIEEHEEQEALNVTLKIAPETSEEMLSATEAQALLIDWCEWNEVSYMPSIDKQVGEVKLYGFLVDYSGWGFESSAVQYCYAWVNSSTGVINFEEAGYSEAAGSNLYGNIPDSMFPIPMRDGAVISYDWFSPPEYVWGVTYVYNDKSVMGSYQAQLRDAGFVDRGTVQSVESLWQYERVDGSTVFTVEMYSGEKQFSMNMYVN